MFPLNVSVLFCGFILCYLRLQLRSLSRLFRTCTCFKGTSNTFDVYVMVAIYSFHSGLTFCYGLRERRTK